ncbi:MAG: hypothetical protein JSS75_07320 [Bacteroidetes bacterium]|nr:hypothetical protein [Bacteroidota bacterium]
MTLQFKIPRQLPSANTIVGKHHFRLYKETNDWKQITRECVISQVPTATIAYFRNLLGEDVKYRIVITAYLFRLYDEDNLWVKAIVDALKGYIITDDRPQLCTIERYQEQIKRATKADIRKGIVGPKPHVIVSVEVIEP